MLQESTKKIEITLGRSRVIGLNLVVKLSANRIACNGTRTSSSWSSETLAALFFGAPIFFSTVATMKKKIGCWNFDFDFFEILRCLILQWRNWIAGTEEKCERRRWSVPPEVNGGVGGSNERITMVKCFLGFLGTRNNGKTKRTNDSGRWFSLTVHWIMILWDFKRLFYHEKVLWYSIKTLFNLKKVFCYSIKILCHLNKFMWYSIKTLNHLKKVNWYSKSFKFRRIV